ncbi:MAG: TIGR01777 family oxidoreductase [Thermodesulfobacteriota bacterium]
MRVIVTGGTGFIGRALASLLLARGHEVAAPSRNPAKAARLLGGRVLVPEWDGSDPAPLAELLDTAPGPSALVNLAGENIAAGRWTAARKASILVSRLAAGRACAAAVRLARRKPEALVQGSAVGYYGVRPSAGGAVLDEDSPSGDGFLAEVCREWEASSARVADEGVRLAVARTGVVLGPGGGALEMMLPPFRFFLGGPPGGGGRWVSWVALADEAAALAFLLERKDASGPFNLTAPAACTMGELCAAVGQALGRPSWLPVPALALRLALGRMAVETVLANQRVKPARLLALGYEFRYPLLGDAVSVALARAGEALGGS